MDLELYMVCVKLGKTQGATPITLPGLFTTP